MQPSEFLKPCFAVVAAWLMQRGRGAAGEPPRLRPAARSCSGRSGAAAAGVIALLLKSQPDFGMLAVVTAVFLAQLFVAGLNLLAGRHLRAPAASAWRSAPISSSRMCAAGWTASSTPARRRHLPVTTALEAFGNGGLFGRGPGEGRVKDVLPDAHADFVFAVAGEEFGMIVCLSSSRCSPSSCCAACCGCWTSSDLFIVLAAPGCGAVRPAGLHQHGLVAAPDPDQGHDPAA